MILTEARRSLREALVRKRQAEREKLWLEDELAWRRLVITVGVRRSIVRKLKARPQREMFPAY